jgi:hypothetical protein
MSKRLRVKTEVLQTKEPSMSKKEVEARTFAISRRIVDMIPSDDLDLEDRELLCKTLDKALVAVPKEMSKLIDTGIIEESYFD